MLVECGKFSSFLDVRTAASLWKTIYEIIEKYKTDIENYMNYENKFIVNELISFLCKHINKSLNKLYEVRKDSVILYIIQFVILEVMFSL